MWWCNAKTFLAVVSVLALSGFAVARSPLAPLKSKPPEATAYQSDYRGDPEAVLARTSWGEISERDLFLYLVMTGADDPLLFEKWSHVVSSPARQQLRERMELALGDMAFMMALEQESMTRKVYDPLDQLRIRFLLYPVQELVWIDKVLSPDIQVREVDVKKYYDEHRNLFRTEPFVTICYIFVQGGSDAMRPAKANLNVGLDGKPLDSEWASALQTMEKARDEIIQGDPDGLAERFEAAARKYSQAPSRAQGGKIRFQRGAFFTEFEDEAFNLDPGHMSSLILGPEGVYMILTEEFEAPRDLGLEESREAIVSRLRFMQIESRHKYGLEQLAQEMSVSNEAAHVAEMTGDIPILKIGDLTLTKDQAWNLFPDIVGADFLFNPDLLSSHLSRLAGYERIVQNNASKGLSSAEMVQQGLVLARRILLSRREAERLVYPRLRIADGEAHQYLLDHPSVFALPAVTGQENVPSPPTLIESELDRAMHDGPGEAFRQYTRKRFSLVEARLIPMPEMGPAQAEWELKRIRGEMLALRDKFTTLSLEQVAEKQELRDINPSDLIPILMERELRTKAGEALRIVRWSSLDETTDLSNDTLASVNDVKKTLKTWIASGERFLPTIKTGNAVTIFYVEQPDYRVPIIAQSCQRVLNRIVAEAIEIETLEAARQRMLASRFQVTLP